MENTHHPTRYLPTYQHIWGRSIPKRNTVDCQSSGASIQLESLCKPASHRLRLVLKDLPGLLLVAHLLDALPLQVSCLGLLKHRVGSPVSPQELGGCVLVEDWDAHADINIVQFFFRKQQ